MEFGMKPTVEPVESTMEEWSLEEPTEQMYFVSITLSFSHYYTIYAILISRFWNQTCVTDMSKIWRTCRLKLLLRL
jgi:hypothetical protein